MRLETKHAEAIISLLEDAQDVGLPHVVFELRPADMEIGLTINNLFNVKWNETQFETITRLKGQSAVDGIAFTPGTKFAALLHISYFFKKF